jgi:serine/threonine protein kinase
VHRDLKPANILSDEYGRAVLADFGLARLPRHTDAFRTVGLTVTGTPLYLAPEQIREPQLEAPAIDHYAYGILAYQLLTGRWPYADPTWSSVTQLHLEAEPVRPGDARPGLDPTVEATLLGLLRKDPRERHQPLDLVGAAADVAPAEWDALIPGGVSPPQMSAALDTQTALTSGGLTTAFGWSASVGETAAPDVRPPALGNPDPGHSYPVDLPGPQPWIEPPVYRPKRKRRLAVRLTVLVGGIVVGVAAYLFWLYT